MMVTNIKLSFQKMIDVNTPIIYIHDCDYIRIDEIINESIGSDNENIFEWNPALGAVNFFTKRLVENCSLQSFLSTNYQRKKAGINQEEYLVLKDIKDYLKEPEIKSLLLLMSQRKLYDYDYNITIILVSSVSLEIPQEIEKFVSYLDIPLPDEEEIKLLIDSHIQINGYENHFKSDDYDKLMPTLKGMTALEIDRMLDMAMSSNGSLGEEDTEMILQQKKQMIKNSGLLELIDTPENLDSVGGMKALKDYLKKKANIMKRLPEAQKAGVATPKGIMMVGMPGCGKSLCAKASAAVFNVPLLRMDMGSMMGKYVGESEGNLRKAIKIAEAAAPCILWIDEIEKAFSGVGSGNESYTTRMFGYFLSWMQDKISSVYVIATANNADSLPPELKRKGRFDEIFCVNLPNMEECKSIFEVCLRKGNRKELYKNIVIPDSLARYTKEKGFNGADIDSVVNDSLEEIFESKGNFQYLSNKLLEVAKRTVCIKESCKEQILKMEEAFKNNCFIDASSGRKSNN